jgi:hypothetical protein
MTAFEIHYTPKQLAKLWGVSDDMVGDLFRNEVDVLRIERPETRHKRGYSTMRILESVAMRVYLKWRKKAA